MSDPEPTPDPVEMGGKSGIHYQIGATEVMYILGLALLFLGLLLWFGIAIALTACGAVLIISALLSDWLRSWIQREMTHAIV